MAVSCTSTRSFRVIPITHSLRCNNVYIVMNIYTIFIMHTRENVVDIFRNRNLKSERLIPLWIFLAVHPIVFYIIWQ